MKQRALALLALAATASLAIATLLVLSRPRTASSTVVPAAGAAPREAPTCEGPTLPVEAEQRVPAQEPHAAASGHRVVLVDEAGSPVVGAEVWIESLALPQRSAADGGVGLPDWTSTALVLADGFSPRNVRGASKQGRVRLERDHGLRLVVQWEDGEPIRGARLTAEFPEASVDPARLNVPIEPTDADGECLVRPHRVNFTAATLRIEPPGSAPAFVRLPEDLDTRTEELLHVLRLPRGDVGHRVRVVDGAGRALADRSVTLHHGPRETARTDPDGRATFAARLGEVRSRDADETGYAVELEPGRSWWYVEREGPPAPGAEVELSLTPVEVHGRVVTPAPASYVVASFAYNPVGRAWRRWPAREDASVSWHALRADGTFGPLPGWQGQRAQVSVRHKDHDETLDFAIVPDDGAPVVLEVPDVCRVTLEVAGPRVGAAQLIWATDEPLFPEDDGRTRTIKTSNVRFLGGPSFSFDVPAGGGEIEVPCGRYAVGLLLAGTQTARYQVDATGPTASLALKIPELVRVDVRISSSLRGPIAGLEVWLRSTEGEAARSARTDADGRIELDFPVLGSIVVVPEWEGERIRMGGKRELEPALDPAQPTAHYVVEEALLRLVESPPSPLLATGKLWLRRKPADGGPAQHSVAVTLGEQGAREYLVAPGTYVVTRRFDARRIQTREVTLAANEQREVVLDSSRLAALALDISVTDPERSELRLRALASDGSTAAMDRERWPGEDPWSFLKVIEPGIYQVEVESRTRGAPITDAPRDVWRGEVHVVPGAQVPLRIHLR